MAEDGGYDAPDEKMICSPEVLEAVSAMDDAYERADRGEHVDWDDLIDRYGVG
jgi:hypothetical protein